ncbi:restriction endonuclease subunit S [Nannocystis sp. ILAH1]|uniref:restriction endonuclease subunit S n=1 Tax=Nannocystis sp. ILAH1 TaxID=2996789 RepID=UPI00226E19B9|nr:restriction endonuclease subunit S [Nannocystis sp. ILAH1]MCY0989017.1 restriction endonuclease subunit S [Nannocystis sp. ILAH1]
MSETSLDWSNNTVGDLCSLLNGLPFKPEDWTQRGVPIIRIQNLNGSQEFNCYDKTIPEAFYVPPGTLLFSWSGNRGTSFGPYQWSGPTGILNQHIFKVSPKPEVDPSWLYYALDIARQLAERAAHGGSGLVHVRRGDLLGYHIPTPPLPQQHKIAQILDFVGEQLQTAEKLVAKLKLVKQGLLHDLLTRGIDDNGELRDPDRHPEQFQDSSLGRIPQNWTAERLGSVSSGGGIYGSSVPALPFDPALPRYVRITDMSDDGVLSSETAASITYEQAQGAILTDGALLFARSGATVGKTHLYKHGDGLCAHAGYVIRFQIDPQRADSEFVYQWTKSAMFSSWVNRTLRQGAQPNINATEYSKHIIPRPPLPEQRQLSDFLRTLDLRLQTELNAAKKLRLLKQALMDDLLTGRVRVTPLLEGKL